MSRHGEQGVALVAALSLIFTASLLVGAMVTISRLATIDVSAEVALARSRYVAEGAANRVRYLIEADRYSYDAETAAAETDYSELESDDGVGDRYLPDSVEHEIDYYGTPVKFRIYNAVGGLNLSSAAYQTTLAKLKSLLDTDDELAEKIDIVQARLVDYLDGNDDTGIDGMEVGDYEELGMKNMPRNAELQYREELLWIPDAADLLPTDADGRLSSVQLIALDSSPQLRPNLYLAGYSVLRAYGNLTEEEAAQVLAALAVWRKDRIMLADQLDELLVANLQQQFSWGASEYYTVRIDRAAPENQPTTRLSTSFPRTGIAGPSNGTLQLLEHFRF